MKSYRVLLWLVAAGFFMQTLDSTIVNTALPSMAAALNESPMRMQSVVIAYGLAMAILIPISGWLADRFGTRRTFFSAILLFTIGSLLCALSQTLPQLVASRIVQGVGGAMLLPVGRLAVLQQVPRAEFLAAMSFVTIPGLVGPLIGPTLGGWIVQYVSWHWIFLINLPVGVVGCLATLRYMPDHRIKPAPKLDVSGFLLLAGSMAAISLALEGLAELGLRGALVIVLLIFGLASLAAYWLHAVKHPAPLFSLRLFEVGTYRIGLLGNLFARIGSGSMPYLIPLTLQIGLARTPMEAGMMMIPTAAAGLAARRVAPPLIARFGYRRLLIGNTICVGLAIASFAFLSADQPTWLRIAQLGLFGAFNSIQFAAMNTLALKDLDSTRTSSGNGLLSVVQMLSMSLGVAAAGTLLAVFASDAPLEAFHRTFLCAGLMTSAAAWIFWQLEPDAHGGEPGSHEHDVEIG